MLVKRVKKTNLYDVFLGEGWMNHARVQAIGGHLKHVSGKVLPKFVAVKASKIIYHKDSK